MSETYFVKTHKKKNFTILDNTCIRDNRLSWKSKGLHTYLMSLPDGWEICMSDLKNRASDGRDSINTAVKELEKYGYMLRELKRTEKGCFKAFCYTVFENPTESSANTDSANMSNDRESSPFTDNPFTVEPVAEKTQLLTTETKTINKKRTELTNKDMDYVAETNFKNKIRELFEGDYPFDCKFESDVKSYFEKSKIDGASMSSYLQYVYERTKLSNVKKSFEGLFRTLALSKSILRDFKNSCYVKNDEGKKTAEQNIKYIDCPICSTRFKEFDYSCPKCGVSLSEIQNKNDPKYLAKKRIYEMPDNERQSYEAALDEFKERIKQQTGRPFLTEDEKIKFWKENNII